MGYDKQGMCTCVDNEPAPPPKTMAAYASQQGWKEVKNMKATTGGGNYLFPKDQILVVLSDNSYKPLLTDESRHLSSLSASKSYLVWYHHLLSTQDWKEKMDAKREKKKRKETCKRPAVCLVCGLLEAPAHYLKACCLLGVWPARGTSTLFKVDVHTCIMSYY
jgi:hypothetical protein